MVEGLSYARGEAYRHSIGASHLSKLTKAVTLLAVGQNRGNSQGTAQIRDLIVTSNKVTGLPYSLLDN